MEQKFEPFQQVLVRISGEWNAAFFSHMSESGMYNTTSYHEFTGDNILPYNDDTKHLLGTKNAPAPKWKPKPDELVAVRDNEKASWIARKFIKKNGPQFLCSHERGDGDSCWNFCEPLRDHFNIPD